MGINSDYISAFYLLGLFAVGWLLTHIMATAYSRPQIIGARTVAVLSAIQIVWLVGYILELLSPDLPTKFFWDKFQWIPIFGLGLVCLKLSFKLNGFHWRPWRLLVCAPAVVFHFLLWTGFPIYPTVTVLPIPPFGALHHEMNGPLLLGIAYPYSLAVISLALLTRAFRRSRHKERARIGFMLAGIALGMGLFTVLFALEVRLMGQRDIGLIASSMGVLVVAWGMFRHRAFDLIPVANGRLLERVSDVVVVLDEDDCIAEMNAAAREWAKATAQAATGSPIGRPFGDVFPEWKEKFDRHQEANRAETEVRQTHLGEERILNFRIEPIHDTQGHWVGRLIMARDMTMTARLLEKLRQSEENYRALIENLRDVVVRTDANGVIQYASPSLKEVLGYAPEEVYGRSGYEFIHPDDVPRATTLMQSFLLHGAHHPYVRFRCLRSDGQNIWVEATGSILHDAQGQVSGIVTVFRDITTRIELETLYHEQEKLEIALRKEQELSELKDRMMARIAHEFRTPLTVIQTSAYLLEHFADRLTAEERREKYQGIIDKIEHITNMLNTISDVVHKRFALREMRFTPLSLAEVCANAIQQIQTERTPRQTITLQADASPTILADYTHLVPAINQILTNAVLYSPDASAIQVVLSERDDRAVVQIIDQGIGIPERERDRVFEPLFRGSNIGEQNGLGLGLTIAQAAVVAHQGKITINSALSQGTTVTLSFPIWRGTHDSADHLAHPG